MFRDHVEFLRQFRKRFETTGAIAPSSRFLARAMTQPLRERTGPARILEVGPGTGAVTRHIVGQLKADERLDLVELNESFAELLRQRFRDDPLFQPKASQSRVHVCGIETFQSDVAYEFVVSGLPLNNFSPAFVEQILEALFALMAPGGVLTFFEYVGVRPLRSAVSGAVERQRLRELGRVMDAFLGRHRFRRDCVLLNLPPAWVQHLRKNGRGSD